MLHPAHLAFLSLLFCHTANGVVFERELSPELDEVLSRHESHLSRLVNADLVWRVRFSSSGQVETYETLIAPGCELTSWGISAEKQYIRWDGVRFEWVVGFNENAWREDPFEIERVRAARYQRDLPEKRLYRWRSLQAVRLLTSDHDLSLRKLCEQSAEAPRVTFRDGLVQIDAAHPGSLQNDGTRSYAGSPVTVILKPEYGYAVIRCRIESPGTVPESSLIQELRGTDFQMFSGNLFLPVAVQYSAEAGGTLIEHEIEFDYRSVNEPVAMPPTVFQEDMVVRDYVQYGDADPISVYLVGEGLALGPPLSEDEASKARYYSLGKKWGVPADAKTSRTLTVLFLSSASVVLLLLAAYMYARYSRTAS